MTKIGQILWRVLKRIGKTQISLLSAGVAFYALLAVFPAIAAVLALAGLFTNPAEIVIQLERLTRWLPEDAAAILLGQAIEVAGTGTEGLSLTLAFGVGFAIYLSTRATTGLIHGLNTVFQREETRGIIRYWSTVIWLTAALFAGIVILFVLLVGLPTALNLLPDGILALETQSVLRAARWLVIAVIFFVGLSLLYRFGPAGGRMRWASPGLVVTALLWFLGSFGFSLYVSEFANYNESFGSLGGVIILLTWLWLSAFSVLLGALVDAETDRFSRKRRKFQGDEDEERNVGLS